MIEEYIAHREEILARIQKLLVARLHVQRPPEWIDPDTPLFGTGLGLDSVDAVELVVSLEAEFGGRFAEDGRIRGAMRTVNTLVDLVLATETERAA